MNQVTIIGWWRLFFRVLAMRVSPGRYRGSLRRGLLYASTRFAGFGRNRGSANTEPEAVATRCNRRYESGNHNRLVAPLFKSASYASIIRSLPLPVPYLCYPRDRFHLTIKFTSTSYNYLLQESVARHMAHLLLPNYHEAQREHGISFPD